MKKTIVTATLLLLFVVSYCQSSSPSEKADSLYKAKQYALAASSYLQAAEVAEFKPALISGLYNAACSYALMNDSTNAFRYLEKAITAGYKSKEHLLKDTDFDILHGHKRWNDLLAAIKQPKLYSDDPLQAKLVTTDIRNFWTAYDMAQKDTANRLKIYEATYIDNGSGALHDYFTMKVDNMRSFMYGHDHKQKFYGALRENTLKVDEKKPQMMQSFVRFKELYPEARFPDIYFIIGNFTSGGASSDNGLLIGIDQAVKTPEIPLDELSLWERNNFTNLDNLPHLIAHELIHFNQFALSKDTTLLSAAIREGMCDFIAELISGKGANQRLHEYAKGKEKQIWQDFEKEMYLKRANNWIGNSTQETADKPADLGYWVGYVICKSYYNNAADKKQALYDILHIKDHNAFYEQSTVGQLVAIWK
jgi:hypothetical protein